jgi:hypothetical protein
VLPAETTHETLFPCCSDAASDELRRKGQ